MQVFNANTLWRNELIGQSAFSVSRIHKSLTPVHQMYNEWVVITRPEYPNICSGFLLLSITVLGPGDSPPVHRLEDSYLNNHEFDESLIIGLPTIERRPYQMHVKIFRAEHLPKMDFATGSSDPFFVVKFNGMQL